MPDGEFEFIARRLRPLATAPGALDLSDDAALLDPAPGHQLVLTKDAMVAGVHFLGDDPPAQIAQKLLRVNLSDLAAMGAAPLGYLVALARSKETTDDWLADFCAGLAADNAAFEIALLGGDTVSTPGPLTLSLTAIGEVPKGEALLRRGAGAGEDSRVARTHGDGAHGLAVLQGVLEAAEAASTFLIERYRLPRPRLALGQALRGLASAAKDISDGMIADQGHILDTTGVGAELHADALLLSPAARDLPGARDAALAGGDDYELLFTAPPKRRADIEALSRQLDLPLTCVGEMQAEAGLHVLDETGRELPVPKAGWQHF
jgi:thiamine-monophosphate kinase